MICPKCHNEVCNQRICPYCGGTVYLEDASLEIENIRYGVRKPSIKKQEVQDMVPDRTGKLETKIDLILVMCVANFFLIVLLFLMIMLGS